MVRKIIFFLQTWMFSLFFILTIPFIYIAKFINRCIRKYDKPKILFGIDPLISNKYWSNMLKLDGYISESIVHGFYSINKKIDFDIVINNKNISQFIFQTYRTLITYDVFCLSFNGGFLRSLPIGFIEPYLYKLLNIKSIIIAYGGDIQCYDLVNKPFYSHVLSSHYPQTFLLNKIAKRNLMRWQKNADFIISAMFFDMGLYRNDLLTPNVLNFPVHEIKLDKNIYNQKDRKNICIVHSPNHRIIKGTEYIINAVNKLKKDFDIDFILLENKSQDEVLKVLREKADIFIEKIVGPSYALSAIEAMAYGIPVIGSVDNGDWDDLCNTLKRYSFLKKCPIVPANVETIYFRLKELCESKKKRNLLSIKSREYVENFHSYSSGQILFKEIIKFIEGQRPPLKNFYHPILGEYKKTI